VAPNAVADATAKIYLAADHDRLIVRDLAKHEHRRPCVYVQADTGDLRDRGLYREVKRASRQWIVQQLGDAPDGIATQDGTAVEVWREVLQHTGIQQCDMRLDDNTPAKQGDHPQQERRRLALVHGMRVGEIRGVEQGEL